MDQSGALGGCVALYRRSREHGRSRNKLRDTQQDFSLESGVKPFRLIDAPKGQYKIEGSCPDLGELSNKELQECNLGQMLVADKNGEWRGFFAFIRWRLVRYLRIFVLSVLRGSAVDAWPNHGLI